MKFYESEYEEALIDLLQQEGWEYTHGGNIRRNNRDILISRDLHQYLQERYPTLEANDLDEIVSHLQHTGGQTNFDILRNTYRLLREGYRYTRHSDGEIFDIEYIDFDTPSDNRFRCVNQYEVGYGIQGDRRIPDVLLFVNGIPLCIFELKNPTDATATIADAYQQIHTRYMRDIPHLLRYCPLSCISDATANNTKLGTTYTPYEHYYAWKKVNNEDKAAEKGLDQVRTIVSGVYAPVRFLEIVRDYIYFPDEVYPKQEEVVCRYPQFFATRMLRESVVQAFERQDNKGGTYFGATGCGKTYTMMFLARQLSLRCPELGSPTIVMIVDREDLQSQAGKLFLRSEDFLSIGAAKIIADRENLKTEMSLRQSGGFFICTIQKFCEEIGLLNTRHNIICFSDEAHRSQVRLNTQLKVRHTAKEGTSPKEAEQIGAFVTKPYAEHLRTAFPNATFVGFTGTPIDETIQVFGGIVDSYTMKQAVDDGITVDLKYIPRIAKVTLDTAKVEEIDHYYNQCAEEGATEADIATSKKAMSAMEVILGDDERLERLAKDIAEHYTQACNNKSDVPQKAMIVCSKRSIAYNLLKKFESLYPDWFVERKSPDDTLLSDDELRSLPPMPTIAMVATRGKDDPKEMYDYLGDRSRTKLLDDAFKMEQSNFRIVIVVDMWITGFDVPCLTYLYNDKPLQKQTLIQTISRVNRKFAGKEFGYVIDYIGIRKNMMEAMSRFGGEDFGPSEDDVQQALEALIVEIDLIKKLFVGFDLTPFIDKNTKPLERLECLSEAANYVQSQTSGWNKDQGNRPPKAVSAQSYFLAHIKRLRVAYDICQPSAVLNHELLSLSQCFMAIASYIRKTSGDKHDAESMNRAVEKMVREALVCNSVVSILDTDVEEQIFSAEFVAQLEGIKLPATKLEVLVKMLRKAIREYKNTNKIAAEKYEELLKETLDKYHERRSALSAEEASHTQATAVSEIMEEATKQALDLLKQLGKDRESFRHLGLTFEEKAFYDILMHLRDKYNFEYGEDKEENGFIFNDKCKILAKKIKELIDIQSSFTDWLNNSNIRADLNNKIFICLHQNGYPPQYNDEVIDQVMEQVEHFKENHQGG
ncbi:type I restriction endonuclease subunit R [Porphyromonas gingivicanis]|uniref:type I restriction endonuclease subunit R n=1 Tax=Porphyromonas gingivicanis TaxID=266762 RepID=UPI00047151C2|nr:HsdR family type I site-specific deoxyribonuclease [Porphyromonas gingivicanis]